MGSTALTILGNEPIAVDDSYSVTKNQILAADTGLAQPGLLDSDSDPTGTGLTLTDINGSAYTANSLLTLPSGPRSPSKPAADCFTCRPAIM